MTLRRVWSGMKCSGAVTSVPLRHDEIALFVIPLVAKPDTERRWIGLLEQFPQSWLIVLLEEFDRAHVGAKKSQVPFFTIEIGQWNPGIVLHDHGAAIEDEV